MAFEYKMHVAACKIDNAHVCADALELEDSTLGKMRIVEAT